MNKQEIKQWFKDHKKQQAQAPEGDSPASNGEGGER